MSNSFINNKIKHGEPINKTKHQTTGKQHHSNFPDSPSKQQRMDPGNEMNSNLQTDIEEDQSDHGATDEYVDVHEDTGNDATHVDHMYGDANGDGKRKR